MSDPTYVPKLPHTHATVSKSTTPSPSFIEKRGGLRHKKNPLALSIPWLNSPPLWAESAKPQQALPPSRPVIAKERNEHFHQIFRRSAIVPVY